MADSLKKNFNFSDVKGSYERRAILDLPDHDKSGYPYREFLARVDAFRRRYALATAETQTCLGVSGSDFRVLDVGCGNGAMLEAIASQGHSFVGLDFVEPLLQQASARNPHANFVVGSACRLPFENNSFHFAYSLGVLQMIQEPESLLAEMVRVIVPGGMGLIEFRAARTRINVLARFVKYSLCLDWYKLSRLMRHGRYPSQPVEGYSYHYPDSLVRALRRMDARLIKVVSRRWGCVDPMDSSIQFTVGSSKSTGIEVHAGQSR